MLMTDKTAENPYIDFLNEHPELVENDGLVDVLMPDMNGVMRGKKMPGHMGQERRTVQNLEIIQVREEDNVLLIKGAIPGSKGDYVIIREAKKRPKMAKA